MRSALKLLVGERAARKGALSGLLDGVTPALSAEDEAAVESALDEKLLQARELAELGKGERIEFEGAWRTKVRKSMRAALLLGDRSELEDTLRDARARADRPRLEREAKERAAAREREEAERRARIARENAELARRARENVGAPPRSPSADVASEMKRIAAVLSGGT